MYTIREDVVYHSSNVENATIEQIVGEVNQVITTRTDNNTVEDVSYTFNLEQGQYIETGRVTRNEPLPPSPPTVEELQAQVNQLIAIIGDMQLGV